MAEFYYIKADTIVGEQENVQGKYLAVGNGRIADIVDEPGTNAQVLDYTGSTLIPGLMDLHVHGREGCDVMDGELSSLKTISRSLASHGVTGFLATTVTASWDHTLKALNVVGEASKSWLPGAQVLGGYSEGLFFTEDHKGAHNELFFLTPTCERMDAMIDAAQGQLKVVALAPEIDGTEAVIEHLRLKDVQVMLGHTNATYDQTMSALNAGACGGVHVFNGMRGIHHREPGCTGAVLLANTQVEVIADGVHLHPAILKLIRRMKSDHQITLISDCINAGGLDDGRYRLGEMDVSVEQGIARTDSGSLAGSTLTLERAVANMSELAETSLRDAVHMASLSPAKFLGIEETHGSIAVGKRADLALLNNEGTVIATFVEGKRVYRSADLPEYQS